MTIGQKLQTIYGTLTVKGKRFSPVLNRVIWYGTVGNVQYDITDDILIEEKKESSIEKAMKGVKHIQGEKGEPGYTPKKGTDYYSKDQVERIVRQLVSRGLPVKGKDYYTPSEIASVVQKATPIKGKDYFEAIDGSDGKTPVYGVDYFTKKQIKGFIMLAVDEVRKLVKDGKPGDKGERGKTPAHKWVGTRLMFKKKDGTWGKGVQLAGKNGARGGGGISTLAQAKDVKLTDLTNSQGIIYNSVTKKWENGSASGASDTAFAISWDGVTAVAPSKNAVYDKVEAMDTAIGLNTAKETNVDTDLSIGTKTATTLDINSSDGDNATIPEANTDDAGLLGADKYDEIVANTLKDTNTITNLSEGASTETTVDVDSSDGTNATLVAASTTRAGLLTKAKWDEIVANSLKSTNATHSGEVTGSGALTIATSAVTLAKMADLAQNLIIGRVTASTGVPEALTATNVRTIINVEDGAEANNISDVNATDLTDGNDTTLHDHDGISENTTHRGLVTGNPHAVTKTEVGLSNVPNTDCTNASNISSGTLPSGVLPPVALTSVQVAISQVAMLALTTEEGDVVVRSDENKSYMHNGGSAGDMTDFTELSTPTDSVLSVNGDTGTVILTQDDIGDGSTYVRTENNLTDAKKTILDNTSNTNTGDQTSIVGITGTKAQFDTAVTDGNITYDGDAPTAHKASHEDGGADEISIAGLAGTPAALSTHESDTTTHGTTGDIVGTTDTQTLTNKTLTSPVLNTGVSGTAKGTGAEVTTGTADDKIVTPKSLGDADVNTRLKTKVLSTIRDMTAATGNVAYTGIGFKPTSLIGIHTVNQQPLFGVGISDSARATGSINTEQSGNFYKRGHILWIQQSSNSQFAALNSYDSDGFTLGWTKQASPTGTAAIIFLATK